jgi:hypothetical protein
MNKGKGVMTDYGFISLLPLALRGGEGGRVKKN